jgi:tetratricopeptide (TPR) repeat protein
MFVLPLVVAPMLLTVPVREQLVPDTTWVGKIVFVKTAGTRIDPSPEPNEPTPIDKGAMFSTMIQYRVYGERPNHVQVKTREGVSGWMRKTDVVLLEDAVAFFTTQIAARPNDASGYSRRGSAWKSKGEFDQALKDATEAIRLSPNAAYYNNRATIWHAKKDYDKAIADYGQAISLNPRYGLAYTNRANMWNGKKEYDRAIEDTTQAMQFDPKSPNPHHVRGVAWQGKKEYDKAIADLNRALELDPKFAQARSERGKAHAARKNYAQAHEDFNEAFRLEPTNVIAASALAFWLASSPDGQYRDGKRALELARRAHQQDWGHVRAIEALAAAHAEMGQFAEAVRWQERALQEPSLKNNDAAHARLELYRQKKPYRQE